MKQIGVNNIRRKALHWWRSLNSEMKKTMVHNPSVNKSSFNFFHLVINSIFLYNLYLASLILEVSICPGHKDPH